MGETIRQNPAKAIQQYKEALGLGYSASIPEVYLAAGIRFDFFLKNTFMSW